VWWLTSVLGGGGTGRGGGCALDMLAASSCSASCCRSGSLLRTWVSTRSSGALALHQHHTQPHQSGALTSLPPDTQQHTQAVSCCACLLLLLLV
jgi:hypothetical protein